jgi:nucleoid-associated protein EbfC
MFNKLKQFQDLRKQAKELKSSMSDEIIAGEALGGDIKIIMDGNQEIKNVIIDESLLSVENKEKLEQGIKEAFASAVKELQSLMMRKMQSGDIQLPNM